MSITPALSLDSIQAIVQRYFEASHSVNKADEMVACFAEDCVNYDPAEGPGLRGHEEFRQFIQAIASLFDTIGLTADFISINGSEASVKWTGHGVTHTGQAVSFEGIDLFEINADGKIQSLRAYWNPAALLAAIQSAGSSGASGTGDCKASTYDDTHDQ